MYPTKIRSPHSVPDRSSFARVKRISFIRFFLVALFTQSYERGKFHEKTGVSNTPVFAFAFWHDADTKRVTPVGRNRPVRDVAPNVNGFPGRFSMPTRNVSTNTREKFYTSILSLASKITTNLARQCIPLVLASFVCFASICGYERRRQ